MTCVVFNGDVGNIYVLTATRFSERLSGERLGRRGGRIRLTKGQGLLLTDRICVSCV